jgi:hypothetical protein
MPWNHCCLFVRWWSGESQESSSCQGNGTFMLRPQKFSARIVRARTPSFDRHKRTPSFTTFGAFRTTALPRPVFDREERTSLFFRAHKGGNLAILPSSSSSSFLSSPSSPHDLMPTRSISLQRSVLTRPNQVPAGTALEVSVLIASLACD